MEKLSSCNWCHEIEGEEILRTESERVLHRKKAHAEILKRRSENTLRLVFLPPKNL